MSRRAIPPFLPSVRRVAGRVLCIAVPGSLLGTAFLEVKDSFCPQGSSEPNGERERECTHLQGTVMNTVVVLGEPIEKASSSVGGGQSSKSYKEINTQGES